jgi:hypothetical protein
MRRLGGALVGIALTLTLGACSGPGTHPVAKASALAGLNTPPPPATRFIYGRITGQSGSTWIVRGIRGNVYMVTVTPATSFGSLFHPVPRDQFKIGNNVRVAGNFAGTAVTATAVSFSARRRSTHRNR